MPPCRVALIGAGHIAEYHLRALRRVPGVKVVGVCDADAERAARLAERAGCPPFASSAALYATQPEVVHVLTPPATHAALTREALAHRCHVYVEKPFVESVAEVDELAAAAAAAGRQVCIGHSLLADPFIRRALAEVRTGRLGKVLAVDYCRSSQYDGWRGGPVPPPYRDGGYPFRDLGVHALYLFEAILGPLRQVEAHFDGRGLRDANLWYDEWRVTALCRDGSGHLRCSWNTRPIQNLLQIEGSEGVLRVDLSAMTVTARRNTRLPKAAERLANALGESASIARQVPWNVVRYLRGKLWQYHGLQTLVGEFHAALAAGRPSPVPPESVRRVVQWTEEIARRADAAKLAALAPYQAAPTAPILVTGAGGFIGRHLVAQLLSQGERVRVLLRRPPSGAAPDPRLEVLIGDLGDPAAVDRAVAGTRLVYHVGAAMRGGAEEFHRGTVAGTANILAAVRRHGVARLVYVSSLSVLHATHAGPRDAVREDWPLEPHAERRGHYTQTKLAAEQLVTQAVREQQVPALILRPGQVFGPGGPVLTGAVARRLGRRLLILGSGRLVLPLVHVDDVVDALLLAATAPPTRHGAIYHLVDDRAQFTQREVAARFGRPIVHMPRLVLYPLAWGVDQLCRALKRPAPLSVYRVRSALAPLRYDCTLARTELGWTCARGARQGLEQVLPQELAAMNDQVTK